MTEMMRECGNWMMAWGWLWMLLVVFLLAGLIGLVVVLIARGGRGSHS